MPMRAVIVVRLSRVTDATTSPERQESDCRALAASRGWDVVDVVQDLDVSGSVDPWQRPALSRVLGEPSGYDVLLVWKLDRLSRSMLDVAELLKWAEAQGISIVSAKESEFDMTSPSGRLMVLMAATFAEMELESIRTRNRSAFEHNFRSGRWRGGIAPYGYKPERIDGE